MENSIDSEKRHQTQVQIEYYLSDENLQRDQFFHTKISEDPNGYLDIDYLMKCNKIAKSGVTKQQIIDAIKQSTVLELHQTNERVRRRDNKPLPELKLLNKKRKKEKDDDDKEEKDENEPEKDNTYDPIILEVKSDKEVNHKNWKKIVEQFKTLNPHLEVAYGRFDKHDGHFGIFKKDEEELKFTDTFELDEINYTVKKCEGEKLISFWKDHGSHYELCVKKTPKKKPDKRTRKRQQKDDTSLKAPVQLGKEIYTDLAKIKSNARRIITTNKDGEKLQDQDQAFIIDLLRYHRSYEEKVKDMEYITTGKPSEYNYSRCFFVIKSGGTREDFSIQKCIEWLDIQNKKKKK